MKYSPFVQEGSKEGEKVKDWDTIIHIQKEKKERFSEDLNRTLNELFDLNLGQNRAKRVGEKREANEKYNLKYQELKGLIRGVMKSPGIGIKVYDKLSRLFTQVLKHRASVQYLVLNGIVEKVENESR